jgi:hypothetical protein
VQCRNDHISTFSIKTLVIIYIVCNVYVQLIVFIIYYCCSLFIVVVHLFCSLFDLHSFFCSTSILCFSFVVHCSKEKDSILILDCSPGISIPLYVKYLFNHCTCCTRIPSPSMQVNKHHTSDCTDFVLVLERVAYYDHGHSRID